METLFIYLLKTMLCSGIMFSYYLLFLKDKTFHYYNRFYLLSIVAVSLALPLLKISYFTMELNPNIILLLEKFNYNSQTNTNDLFYFQMGFAILGVVAVFYLVKFLIGIFKIQQFKKIYPKESSNGIDFYTTDLENAPFSFFKNLFWKNSILLNSNLGKQILKHEMVHIEQKHSLDKIFVEVLKSIFWFNPFFWLIKKEIHLIHEYLADKKAVKNSDNKAFAQMILASHFSGNVLPATNPFLNSNLKKRLNMLQKSKTKFGYLRKILVLPLLFTIGFIYLVNAKNKEIETTNKIVEDFAQEIEKDTIRPTVNIQIVDVKEDGYSDGAEIIVDSTSRYVSTEVYSPSKDVRKSQIFPNLKNAPQSAAFSIEGKKVSKKEFEDFLQKTSDMKDYVYVQTFRHDGGGVSEFLVKKKPTKEEYEETLKNLRIKLNDKSIKQLNFKGGGNEIYFSRHKDNPGYKTLNDQLNNVLKEYGIQSNNDENDWLLAYKLDEETLKKKNEYISKIIALTHKKNGDYLKTEAGKREVEKLVTDFQKFEKNLSKGFPRSKVDNPWIVGLAAHPNKKNASVIAKGNYAATAEFTEDEKSPTDDPWVTGVGAHPSKNFNSDFDKDLDKAIKTYDSLSDKLGKNTVINEVKVNKKYNDGISYEIKVNSNQKDRVVREENAFKKENYNRIFINGKKATKQELSKLNPKNIKTMKVNKREKDGVKFAEIRVQTKS